MVAYLRPVGVERGLGIVECDCFAIEIDSCRPVSRSKGFVALVLEVDGFLRHGDADKVGHATKRQTVYTVKMDGLGRAR